MFLRSVRLWVQNESEKMRQRPNLSKFALFAFVFLVWVIFLLIRSSNTRDIPPFRFNDNVEDTLNSELEREERNKKSEEKADDKFLSDASPKLREAIAEWKECIKENFNESQPFLKFWHSFTYLVNDCANNTAVKVIRNNAIGASNIKEMKYHVLDKKNTSAVVVTLGVGKEITAEQQLKEKLPKGTEFFGADPNSDENSELFQKIGKFYPFAVGATNGSYTARVYKNGKYINMEMTHISLVTFLRDIVNRTRIDQLLMDNEYAEYDLLPQFTRAAELDAAAIQVCQLNTEMHLTRGNKELMGKFVKIVKQILHGDRWLPLFVDTPHHHRVFLVNYETKYCRETYLEQFFV